MTHSKDIGEFREKFGHAEQYFHADGAYIPIANDIEQWLTTKLNESVARAEKRGAEAERVKQIADLRYLAENLEAMYGRTGIGAIYDSIRDFADKLERAINNPN